MNPDPTSTIRPRRKITGMSAILLPFRDGGGVDWDGFSSHVGRTRKAGLSPAVNMDTGYVNLIDVKTQREVLKRTREITTGKPFVAGVFIGDQPGNAWNPDAYRERLDDVVAAGGTPVVMQSFGLTSLPEKQIPDAYREITEGAGDFIAFELGTQFAPFGKIYSLDTYERLMEIPNCVGTKHSSLSRNLEWDRLALRDAKRQDFKVFTGNDLAIDMVMYGSDYLLGLSTFAPDLFALRDAMWERGDRSFYELNDILQYLGFFAFRPPVPAYKHNAAQFLKLQGWIGSTRVPEGAVKRPDSDVPVLQSILDGLNAWREPR